MPQKLLEGIKVADFTWAFTGPLMTKTLGDCGAEVIKIEGRTKGDEERRRHPYKDAIPGLNRAIDFNCHNTSKLSIALNLTKPRAKEINKQLVAWADIVVENFAGGAMERMGLGYEVLRKVNPDIIMMSTCMQGQTGPHAHHPGFGHQLSALSGFHNIVGWPDRAPPHIWPYTDFVAVHFGLLAIMASLDYRARTGKGQYIDMSQYELAMQFVEPLLLDYNVNKRIDSRNGNRHDYAAPHGVYRCRENDRWCTLAVFTDKEWQSFCEVIGNPEWTRNEKFVTLMSRKENEDELDKLVEDWTVNHLTEEVMQKMQTSGVAAGLVATAFDLDIADNDPQLRFRHFNWKLEHPEVGKYRSPRPPFLASKAAYEVRRTPLLGEHNEYICKEILGMSDEEIAEAIIEEALE
ncbi:MAG: CoA transferase [Dehalococcoidales bacterium]|nr:CoA transferase [Dehalococcoidales bacterium]